ncbi:hypothetical protein HELRODRAFT_102774 [Helobdella robusta]|uniref:Bicarbonate transporter-like transmembrane domain-containing protein n=1 Tax=Helobdella robusta TaxID=6412 RepID=T1EDB6_HELRO|nr:hypothetical protein HELRODRAFT_102774 [Helobdella robusta]ESN94964.1 hypothetical protein HELRODRAFT_102774 [Helobdella robusta]
MVVALIDYLIPNTYTEKLDVPEGFTPTAPHKRSWVINPLGSSTTLSPWLMFGAIVPSVLIFILLYMESVITSMIVNKKDRLLKKGSGYHLDLFVTGLCASICGLLGLPFMCSATVRSVTHVSALSVYSRTHAPGVKPHLVKVVEQRVTSLAVHLLVGVSVLMGPMLKQVPLAVLFGIFLYMGIASMTGIQLVKRCKLAFMPVKHHPDVGYVKRVRLRKMNLFTFLQLLFLAILWIVKSTKAALAFPFILILIIPIRIFAFKLIFTELELHELDKEEDCPSEDEEVEPDFYTQAHMPI